MRARFLADANLRFAIVRGFWRKVPEGDFLAAAGQLPVAMPYPEVLNLAAKLGRVLVSHDFETMPAHLYKLLETTESPGIVLIPQPDPILAPIATSAGGQHPPSPYIPSP